MMDQFFRQEGQTSSFGFNQMRRELNHLQNQPPLAPVHTQTPPPGRTFSIHADVVEWMNEFNRSGAATPLQLRPEERARMEAVFPARPMSANQQPWDNKEMILPPPDIAQRMDPLIMGPRPYHLSGMHHDLDAPILREPIPDQKGKSRMMELDEHKWEEQFRAFEDSMKDDEANKAIDKELDQQESEAFFGDFESIWNGIRAEDAERMASGDMDFMDRFNDDIYDSSDIFDGKPDLGDYLFEPNNPYMTHENPFQEGVRILESGGSLSEAALCFEAVCQLEPSRVEGWTYLGTVQAQNEKELAAIRALEQSIRLDEANLPALMVSYLLILSNSRIWLSRIRTKDTIPLHISL